MKITVLDIVKEFTNDDVTYGVYKVEINGTSWNKNQIFIRNDKSIGMITFSVGEPATKCISIIRSDVATEFMTALNNYKSSEVNDG